MRHVGRWSEKASPVLLTAAVIVLLDQWTKAWARHHVEEYTAVAPVAAWSDFLQFEYVRNYGAALGFFANQSWLFILVPTVVCAVILIYTATLPSRLRFLRILLGLQLGGVLGNLSDRLFQIDEFGRGYVTDFVRMGIPDLFYLPLFNIADSAIFAGLAGLLMFALWFDVRQRLHSQ